MFEKERELTHFEIEKLKSQGCRANDWGQIKVAEGFSTDNIYNTKFGKEVYLGCNLTVSNIGCCIENTIICDGAIIENVGTISSSAGSNFGIGVEVSAVNENGGRKVPLYSGINAQSAYYIAMYRHKTEEINKIFALVEEQKQSQTNKTIIGKNSIIRSCTTIDGVHLSENSVIEGALMLKNGSTVGACHIGYGVILEDFMVEKGAKVLNSAQMKRVFVGENVKIDGGFMAIDSLFFANCDLASGECCSVFAGPYTVSHHRSSLLIAGLFSFFNAGSGSNQSNHLFKTGAVHQAIHERGCKYGSNAYIMAPARTGAYTVVLSRHSSHHDTSDFPFSYLLDSEGKSYLMPGASLKSSGTQRDIEKWAARDKREGEKRDLIHFDKYNPYIGSKIAKAIEHSQKMLEKKSDSYTYNRVKITYAMLSRGLKLYNQALDATLATLLKKGGQNLACSDEWVDMAGMYAPKSAIDALEIDTLEQFHRDLKEIYNNYENYAYSWALSFAKDQDLEQIIAKGEQAIQNLDEMASADIKTDSAKLMQVGYGIDETNAETKEKDFITVRGL